MMDAAPAMMQKNNMIPMAAPVAQDEAEIGIDENMEGNDMQNDFAQAARIAMPRPDDKEKIIKTRSYVHQRTSKYTTGSPRTDFT